MTTSTVVTMIIGLLIPVVVVALTKSGIRKEARHVAIFLASTASGVISAIATSPPATLSGWEHVGINLILTWVAALTALSAGTSLGTKVAFPTVDAATSNVGFGPPPGATPSSSPTTP